MKKIILDWLGLSRNEEHKLFLSPPLNILGHVSETKILASIKIFSCLVGIKLSEFKEKTKKLEHAQAALDALKDLVKAEKECKNINPGTCKKLMDPAFRITDQLPQKFHLYILTEQAVSLPVKEKAMKHILIGILTKY
mgnify:CR=1 FL=1